MMLVRLLIRVVLCLLVFVVAFYSLYIWSELSGHPYLSYVLPGAFVVMLLFLPFIARMRLGKGAND